MHGVHFIIKYYFFITRCTYHRIELSVHVDVKKHLTTNDDDKIRLPEHIYI